MENLILKARIFAQEAHKKVNSTYGENKEDYVIHLDDVFFNVKRHKNIFIDEEDYIITACGAYCHDTIEDAGITFNDLKRALNRSTANIVLAVTDVPAENRLLRRLLTLPKTIVDHRAIVLKMTDILANGTYSKAHQNGKKNMFLQYQEEHQYLMPIFSKAVKWHYSYYNVDELNKLINELNNVFK